MKTIKLILIPLLILIFSQACDVYESNYYEVDYTAPNPPTGVIVKNGDNRVDLFWDHNREPDLAGYNVYYSDSYDGRYYLIGSTSQNYFIDYDAINGDTYYYGICAYDLNGNESELSIDVIYASPRPEGFNQAIFDYRQFPNNSGYSFALYSVVRYDSIDVDFFFEKFQANYYLNVWDDTDIQDMGQTESIYDIEYAPTSGWSATKDAVAVVGHTYVIWTWDNHFAKIRISSITSERMVFDWAYQLVEGNVQLKSSRTGGYRNSLTKNWL
ncbi:MAG: hypothetical protein R3321_13155, partial [Nitrososphaeraceae archaeon]|nr:hypothetical protein [Nitrososphaeraceae archaeon]